MSVTMLLLGTITVITTLLISVIVLFKYMAKQPWFLTNCQKSDLIVSHLTADELKAFRDKFDKPTLKGLFVFLPIVAMMVINELPDEISYS